MTQNSKKKDPLGYIMGVAVDCENVKKIIKESAPVGWPEKAKES